MHSWASRGFIESERMLTWHPPKKQRVTLVFQFRTRNTVQIICRICLLQSSRFWPLEIGVSKSPFALWHTIYEPPKNAMLLEDVVNPISISPKWVVYDHLHMGYCIFVNLHQLSSTFITDHQGSSMFISDHQWSSMDLPHHFSLVTSDLINHQRCFWCWTFLELSHGVPGETWRKRQ